MNAPTLGYQEDSMLSKHEIARQQLVEAIRMFLLGKYICAVTLGGAAEEVMSCLLRADGRLSAVEESSTRIAALLRAIGLKTVKPKKDTEHYKEWNRARNTLKHYNHEKEPDIFTLNEFDEAYWMIERALRNAELLGVPVSNYTDYRNWVIANINI